MTTTPAGWYPDPHDATHLRYWDGSVWTEALAPAGTTAPAAPAPVNVGQGALPQYGAYASGSYPTQPGQLNPYAVQNPSNTLSIIGMVLGGLGLLFPLAAVAGLICAGIGKSKKERLSTAALIVAGIGLVAGFVLGAALALAFDL